MKSKVVRQNVVFVLAMILTTIYLFWRLFFTLPLHDGVWNVVAGVLLLVAETVTIATTFDLFLQRIRMKRFHLELPEIAAEDYPDVDVLIATHNEEIDLLYKTVSACTFMDYPDKHKVHIFVCDDGNRPEVAEMAAGLGVGYIGLENNTEAKSGNYNNALKHTGSAIFATFDTDMIPRHDFLMKTVPYFLLPEYVKEGGVWRRREPDEMDGDTAIGLVQTPQSFYNPDLFQFNLYAEHIVPNEQDFFSRQVNVMRNTSNSVAYTGSNAVLSRKAMEDIGGFPLNTITEDFETSLRMQQLGYTTYASDEVVSRGSAPRRFRHDQATDQMGAWHHPEHAERAPLPQGKTIRHRQDILSGNLPVLVVLRQQTHFHPRTDSVRIIRFPHRGRGYRASAAHLASRIRLLRRCDALSFG